MLKMDLQFFGGRGAASVLANNPYARLSIDAIERRIADEQGKLATNRLYAGMGIPDKSSPGYSTLRRRIMTARKNVDNANDELKKLQQALTYAQRHNTNIPF